MVRQKLPWWTQTIEQDVETVTANENQSSSYKFTQANQRNPWTILDWTSQIPLKVTPCSENNLEE